jgi:hypothetical protein
MKAFDTIAVGRQALAKGGLLLRCAAVGGEVRA